MCNHHLKFYFDDATYTTHQQPAQQPARMGARQSLVVLTTQLWNEYSTGIVEYAVCNNIVVYLFYLSIYFACPIIELHLF